MYSTRLVITFLKHTFTAAWQPNSRQIFYTHTKLRIYVRFCQLLVSHKNLSSWAEALIFISTLLILGPKLWWLHCKPFQHLNFIWESVKRCNYSSSAAFLSCIPVSFKTECAVKQTDKLLFTVSVRTKVICRLAGPLFHSGNEQQKTLRGWMIAIWIQFFCFIFFIHLIDSSSAGS